MILQRADIWMRERHEMWNCRDVEGVWKGWKCCYVVCCSYKAAQLLETISGSRTSNSSASTMKTYTINHQQLKITAALGPQSQKTRINDSRRSSNMIVWSHECIHMPHVAKAWLLFWDHFVDLRFAWYIKNSLALDSWSLSYMSLVIFTVELSHCSPKLENSGMPVLLRRPHTVSAQDL